MTGSEHPQSGSEQVPSKDDMLGTDFDHIIARMKAVVGVKTDAGLTRILGVHENSIRSNRARGKIPDKWYVLLGSRYNVSVEWLQTGKGQGPRLKPQKDATERYPIDISGMGKELIELAELIELMETRIQSSGQHLPPDRKAKMIVFVYKLWLADKELAIEALEAFLPPANGDISAAPPQLCSGSYPLGRQRV